MSNTLSRESHALLVLADSIENVVGPLHRATVKIMLSSPIHDRTEHAALTKAVNSETPQCAQAHATMRSFMQTENDQIYG